MDNYGMIFAGMLAMALFGGLIAFLIIRPWTRPMRRDWEAGHEVVAENSRLAAAQVRRQTAEEQVGAMQAAIAAEETRARLIEAQVENDQADNQKQIRAIEAEVAVENARIRLIEVRAENDQLEIERRTALRQAGVDPDAPPPWKIKRQYIVGLVVTLTLFIVLTVIKIYFSK